MREDGKLDSFLGWRFDHVPGSPAGDLFPWGRPAVGLALDGFCDDKRMASDSVTCPPQSPFPWVEFSLGFN